MREILGALRNGVLVAVVTGGLVLLASLGVDIHEPQRLALACAASLICVTVMAASVGSSIPLVLDHFKIDPAMATGVSILTINDIFGVWVFFMLSSWIYLG